MDNKQIDKINIIKAYLPKCISTYDTHIYGNIPQNKFLNACNSYVGKVEYKETIGLIDETVFGSGKKGFLFTFDGYYYDGCKSIHLYKENIKFKSLKSPYNLAMMNEMLQKLYEIEVKKSKLENFLDATLEIGEAILDSIGNINDIAEHIADELFGDEYTFDFTEVEDFKENMQQIADNIRKANNFLEKMDSVAERAKSLFGSEDEDSAIGLLFVYLEKAESGLAKDIDELFESLITNLELDITYEEKLENIVEEIKYSMNDWDASQGVMVTAEISAFIAKLKVIKLQGTILLQYVDAVIENI